MKFDYKSYVNMIENLKKREYQFASYENYNSYSRCVILRHDIDNSIDCALELARLENSIGVRSTYFVLVSSDFYNAFSYNSVSKLKEIIGLGHNIGLHFDETNYDQDYYDRNGGLCPVVEKEALLLSDILQTDIKTVSMHRPSKQTLAANYTFPNLINSYGDEFFQKFKYVSDSRRCWREDVDSIIMSGEYDKLQILTHPIWYHEVEENIHSTIYNYVNSANKQRYNFLKENITSLEEILPWGEVK